jgi:nucleoside-diphosphate-sugar epimerase
MLRPAILVTGTAGFIGTMLVNALIRKGHEVVAVDRDPRLSPSWQSTLT